MCFACLLIWNFDVFYIYLPAEAKSGKDVVA